MMFERRLPGVFPGWDTSGTSEHIREPSSLPNLSQQGLTSGYIGESLSY